MSEYQADGEDGDASNDENAALYNINCQGEKAFYIAGQGTYFVDEIEEDLRNIDEVIQERCHIPLQSFCKRSMTLC